MGIGAGEGGGLRRARASDEDAEGFCRLSNALYARPVNEAYYEWQFFGSPFPSLLASRWAGRAMLDGCYGFHVKEAQSGERVAWAIDIMVASELQGRGLFRPLSDFAREQAVREGAVGFVVMANARADRAHVLGLAWRRIEVLETCFCHTTQASPRYRQDVEFERIDDFEGLRPFLASLGPVLGTDGAPLISMFRGAAYLNWRFVRNPRYSYDLFAVRRRGELFGYLVLKIFQDPVTGRGFGDIVDLRWAEDDREVLADMLRYALEHFRTEGVETAAIWLQTNTILDRVGVEAGFCFSGQRRFFCGSALDTRLTDARRWFLTLADSEVY